MLRILLANPRGFCAGVDRAIQIVELALARYGPPIYVRHGIVHNRSVTESLSAKGVVFVESPSQAPAGSVLIFSAHGVSPAVRQEAERRGLEVIDATCPLVTKVHHEARRYAREDAEIVLIGHANHVEVEGTRGEAPDRIRVVETTRDARRLVVRDPQNLGVITQTTLSIDDTREIMNELRGRFPALRMPRKDDICYATQNRQDAVKRLAARADRVLIVGSPESSNGMRLVEAAQRAGADVLRVEDESEIDRDWLVGARCVGVTAGAAVPEPVIEAVVARIAALSGGDVQIDTLAGAAENIRFPLPSALRGVDQRV